MGRLAPGEVLDRLGDFVVDGQVLQQTSIAQEVKKFSRGPQARRDLHLVHQGRSFLFQERVGSWYSRAFLVWVFFGGHSKSPRVVADTQSCRFAM